MSIFEEPVDEVPDIDISKKLFIDYESDKSIPRKQYVTLPMKEDIAVRYDFSAIEPFQIAMNHMYGEGNWLPITYIKKKFNDLNKRAWMYEELEYAEFEIGSIESLQSRGDIIINLEIPDEEYATLVDNVVSAPKDVEISIYAYQKEINALRFFGVYKLESVESILQHRLILKFWSDTDETINNNLKN